jgi:hypothetical protein
MDVSVRRAQFLAGSAVFLTLAYLICERGNEDRFEPGGKGEPFEEAPSKPKDPSGGFGRIRVGEKETRTFMDPLTGERESVPLLAPLWVLLFGFIYLARKGAWGHAYAYVFAGFILIPVNLFWLPILVYPFFAYRILKKRYLKKGWIPVR